MTEQSELLKKFAKNAPATDAAIGALEASTGLSLPPDYRLFLAEANGGEGFVGESYLMLWRVEDLESINVEYEVAKYLTNVLLIGSSGGGEAYGFDVGRVPWSVIRVPFIVMEANAQEEIAPTLSDFLELLYTSDELCP
ncbi:MAG TPA: SMI1/KNR4 family protein [Pirellulales bacterium]|nr:SMI1/KNR4 family protein [Pirellulales bacterium]